MKINKLADEVIEMINEYVDTLEAATIINIVIDHMLDNMTKTTRLKVYNQLSNTKSRDHGNWFWIIRRIRNTGAASRLSQ